MKQGQSPQKKVSVREDSPLLGYSIPSNRDSGYWCGGDPWDLWGNGKTDSLAEANA